MQFDITVPTIHIVEAERPTAYTVAPLRGSATVVVATRLLSELSEVDEAEPARVVFSACSVTVIDEL